MSIGGAIALAMTDVLRHDAYGAGPPAPAAA
jgi:hypothetical protein